MLDKLKDDFLNPASEFTPVPSINFFNIVVLPTCLGPVMSIAGYSLDNPSTTSSKSRFI
jgi:hypothetical protein